MAPCKPWQGCRNRDGYGVRRVGGVTCLVHRLACIEAHGPPPPDKPEAIHSCDNPACYEPSHLRWGSRKDNMEDMSRKGRAHRGERHQRTLLTDDDVRAIRAGGRQRPLAQRYGISVQQVSRIQKRQQWRHVE